MSDEMRKPPDDPDAPPTREEIAAAEALRDALADPSRANASADFARAASLAHAPRDIDPSEHAAIVARALAAGGKKSAPARRVIVRASFATATAALAMAAGFALLVSSGRSSAPSAPAVAIGPTAPMVPPHSTQPLFHEPFARSGGESARIDRIAMARASDLRENQFAQWGVR